MIDSVAIVSIIAGCSALIVAVLHSIKTSSCRNGEIVVRTTESHTPTTTEEHFNYGNMIESVTDRPPSPAILKVPEPSEPIPIPKPETPSTLRKNYL